MSIRIYIPEGSCVANLSATDSKRSENTIVGMHALAGRIGSRQLSQAYHDGRLRFSRVRMTEYLVEYSQFIGIYSTDTSAALPEIYDGTFRARNFFFSSVSSTMSFRYSSRLDATLIFQ